MTTRDFEAEIFAAMLDNRREGATLAQRARASELAERIADEADAAGVDMWSKFLDIDERARLTLYPSAR